MQLKFVQLATSKEELYGLDENGQIWRAVDEYSTTYWRKLNQEPYPKIAGGCIVPDEE